MTIALRREKQGAFMPTIGDDKPLEDLPCPRCLNKFTGRAALNRHIASKHDEPDEDIEDELQDEFGDLVEDE